MSASSRPRWCVPALLAALSALAFLARAAGLGAQLPHHQEPLAIFVWRAAAFELPAGKPMHVQAYRSTNYPLLLSGLLGVLPGSSYTRPAPREAPLEQHLARASEPYMRGRWLVAALSSLLLPATFVLARRWLATRDAVLAALFAGTSLLALHYGRQARPHAVVAALTTIAIVACLQLLARGRRRDHLLAGIASGLALACLHTGAFVLPSLFCAWLWSPASTRAGVSVRRERWIGAALVLVPLIAAFVLAYPFLLDGGAVLPDGKSIAEFGEQRIPWRRFQGTGLAWILAGLWSYDPVLLALAVAGLVVLIAAWVRRHPALRGESGRAVIVAALHPLLTLAAFSTFDVPNVRFVLPLVASLSILAAAAVSTLATSIGVRAGEATRWRTAALFAALFAAVLTLPAWRCARQIVLALRPDTETLAARWLDAHASRGERVLMSPWIALPRFESIPSLRQMPDWIYRPWQRYQVDWPDVVPADPPYEVREVLHNGFLLDHRIDVDEVRFALEESDARWAVVAVLDPDMESRDATREVMRALGGEPVARFEPCAEARDERDAVEYDADTDLGTRLARAVRLGPPIEIYQLPRH